MDAIMFAKPAGILPLEIWNKKNTLWAKHLVECCGLAKNNE